MANRITDAPAMIQSRHGRSGDVALRADIDPDLRARLVEYCRKNDVTIRWVVNEALDTWLQDRGR